MMKMGKLSGYLLIYECRKKRTDGSDRRRSDMEMVKLVRPSEDYADAIWDFRQEILAADDVSKFAGCSALLDSTDAHGWIQKVTVLSDPATCPDDLIPSDSYLAIRPSDDRLVGTIDLRHSIDHPVLGTWGGQIGYEVRPSERRKGYASQMLGQVLDRARELGLDKVLITCHRGNIASQKTIERVGGVFDSLYAKEDGTIVKRYWVAL